MADVDGDGHVYKNVGNDGSHSRTSSMISDVSSGKLTLDEGSSLNEESKSDPERPVNRENGHSAKQDATGRRISKQLLSYLPSLPTFKTENKQTKETTQADDTEEEFKLPADGNLQRFSVDNMATFFSHLQFTDRIVARIRRRRIDGRRFAKLTDSAINTLELNNPFVIYFRDKSKRNEPKFVL